VQVDALALKLRPRTPYEAADLGTRLCQSAWRDVYRCYAAVALPMMALCIASIEIAPWLPIAAMWWLRPWLDRTILFVLSRAAFGQRTSLADLWSARRHVFLEQLFITLTWRLLSPWRSFTQAVYQLEGLSFGQYRKRVKQIRRKRSGSAMFMTIAYMMGETSLIVGLGSLLYWFAPQGQAPELFEIFTSATYTWVLVLYAVVAAAVTLFLEPFYVASGFAMYLSRRAELEAWDIEQEFRRAFAQ
jgi:hypothetical protein